MTKIAILIDGGYLRKIASATYRYNPDFIESMVQNIVKADEQLFRVLYYDCDPYCGKVTRPISGSEHGFQARSWLDILAAKNFFAVRRGVLKFRGFKLKDIPAKNKVLSDEDFSPVFEQKGVDMRLGIDIANFSTSKAVKRIILISGDTDCVPAMKYGRIAGLQIVIVQLPKQQLARELSYHADECRSVKWPANAQKFKE